MGKKMQAAQVTKITDQAPGVKTGHTPGINSSHRPGGWWGGGKKVFSEAIYI